MFILPIDSKKGQSLIGKKVLPPFNKKSKIYVSHSSIHTITCSISYHSIQVLLWDYECLPFAICPI